MFGFSPTDEQKMLVDSIARFCSLELRPAAHAADEEGRFAPMLINKGWNLGFLQASIPEMYGGFGERSVVTGVLAAEELAFGDVAGAMAIFSPSLFVLPILLAGDERQKNTYIPSVIENDWMPYSAALIEPYYDFDPGQLKTSVSFSGAGYILNGKKAYVPYAVEAGNMIVYARFEGKTRAFIVRKGAPGLHVLGRMKLMGINALPLYEVSLENVLVEKEDCLPGEVDMLIASMQVTNAALAVGLARAAFEYARDYAKEREAFGLKIGQKQAIAFMLAEMAMEIEASRLLNWEAAWKLDVGKEDATRQAYLSATSAADMVMMVTDRAVQILGGHGYIREHPVELWMRNGRGFTTFTGLAVI